jgi:hypothetical protein
MSCLSREFNVEISSSHHIGCLQEPLRYLFLAFFFYSGAVGIHATIQEMPEASTAKAPMQKRDRLVGAVFVAGKTLIVSFVKTFYALWLEVTGLLFAMFAVAGGAALVRQYRADHFHDHQRFLLVGALTVVCTWFTLVSFVRARRMRK